MDALVPPALVLAGQPFDQRGHRVVDSVSLTDVKDSPVGVNVGVDGTYLIRTIKGIGIGVGGFVRYSGASLDLPTALNMTRDTELKAGGPQGGAGLRFRF